MNFPTEIILLPFDKMKDITLMDSTFAKKNNNNNKHRYSQVNYSEL